MFDNFFLNQIMLLWFDDFYFSFQDDKINWWDDVYGFDMSSLQEPLVDVVDKNQVVSNSCLLKEIDIQTCTKDDIPFDSPFTLKM